MPLGHNRRDPEFGKVVPDGCPPERPEADGLGPAILLSLGLHVLVGLLVWHGFVARKTEDPATRIIDTRVRNPELEVEVCLKLLDSPKPGLKKESSHPVSSSIRSSPTSPGATDPPKTSRVAGAESSKPRQSYQDLPLLTGASKTRPQPPKAKLPIPSSNGEYLPGGFSDGSGNSTGGGDGATSFF